MKDGNLVVTDLNSTNGTFIDDKRLTPGVPAIISPGRLLTFGNMSPNSSLPNHSFLTIHITHYILPNLRPHYHNDANMLEHHIYKISSSSLDPPPAFE